MDWTQRIRLQLGKIMNFRTNYNKKKTLTKL